jgi:hypothetical protein
MTLLFDGDSGVDAEDKGCVTIFGFFSDSFGL